MDEGSPSSKRQRVSQPSGSPSNDASDAAEAKKNLKASKACLNCRRQKMRCEMDDERPPCRRCKHSNTQCLFKVRANAVNSTDWFISELGGNDAGSFREFQASVLGRLAALESQVGINSSTGSTHTFAPVQIGLDDSRQTSETYEYSADSRSSEAVPDLRAPRDCLVAQSSDKEHAGWSIEVVETLWLAFAEYMPPLHFSTHDFLKNTPTPILLAAVLQAAAMQHSLAQYADLSPFYQAATARAIAVLVVPEENAGTPSPSQNLNNALGIIITLLFSEAWIPPTGLWIAMVYQIILTGATRGSPTQAAQWRGLYQGLRVIDIEHASLQMMRPILPLTAPLPSLEHPATESLTYENAYAHLTTIMHVGLSHFCTRYLPTIIQTVLGDNTETSTPARPYTAEDARVIKGWAGELDNWLMKYHRPSRAQQRGPSEANILLLQYQLQKLFVLSIDYPARGIDITKTSSSPERKELLKSARAALQLQRLGLGVWSNWDLIIITSAAHIVIDCSKDSAGGVNDRGLVQGHINALKATHQPAPNLRLSLAERLESRLRQPTTVPVVPSPGMLQYLFNPDISNALSHQLQVPARQDALRSSAMTATLAPPLPFNSIDWSETTNDSTFDSVWSVGDSTDNLNDPTLWPAGFQRVLGIIGGQKEMP